jgi:peptide/nickel transport system substrate-binding protein
MAEETIPSLAESWEISKDGRRYTFRLREVSWSDGEPFTDADVVFTFDCIFAREAEPDPETGERAFRYPSRYLNQYTIAGEPIRYWKEDERTVVFETADVYAPFLNDIGFAAILPEHKLRAAFEDGSLLRQWSTQTAIETPGEIVGTGPFRIRSYRPGERLVLEPNPHYWRFDGVGKRLPYLDFLVFKFVKESNAQVVLFATGQTDASGISVTDVAWVRKAAGAHDFTIYDRGPDTGISFFWFNQHPGANEAGQPYVPPHKLAWFRNPAFRRALLYGFDREGVVDGVYFGRAELLHSPISRGNRKWHNPDVRRYPYDPGKARELLRREGFRLDGETLRDAAGNPVGFELLLYDGSQRASAMATTFAENMGDLGIAVKISYLDFGALLKRTGETFDYEMSFIGWTGGGDPSGGKALYHSSGLYHVWYPEQPEPATAWEARIDEIIEASERTLNEAERIRLYGEMQAIFAEQVPMLFTVTPNTYSGIQNRWRNVQVPPTGSILWNLDELWTEEPQP